MAKFLVSYDLMKPGQNYNGLINRLQTLRAKKVLLSAWALSGNHTCVALRDDLRRFIDANDRLLVSTLNDWASYNAMTDINQI